MEYHNKELRKEKLRLRLIKCEEFQVLLGKLGPYHDINSYRGLSHNQIISIINQSKITNVEFLHIVKSLVTYRKSTTPGKNVFIIDYYKKWGFIFTDFNQYSDLINRLTNLVKTSDIHELLVKLLIIHVNHVTHSSFAYGCEYNGEMMSLLNDEILVGFFSRYSCKFSKVQYSTHRKIDTLKKEILELS